MQETLHGIVLRTVRYGDNRAIIDLFTREHGRQSFITSVSAQRRSRRSVRTVSLWQPLSMVELTAEMHQRSGLPRPTDVRVYHSYTDLPFSPIKSSLALFLVEFLSAALREEKTNLPLYAYIESSLLWLDADMSSDSVANFHIVFLIRLSRFLGIYPNLQHPTPLFDLLAASYCTLPPPHTHVLRGAEASLLPTLFRINYSTMRLFRFSRAQRQRILHVLVDYYRLHLPAFPELRSLEVLMEMFDSPT